MHSILYLYFTLYIGLNTKISTVKMAPQSKKTKFKPDAKAQQTFQNLQPNVQQNIGYLANQQPVVQTPAQPSFGPSNQHQYVTGQNPIALPSNPMDFLQAFMLTAQQLASSVNQQPALGIYNPGMGNQRTCTVTSSTQSAPTMSNMSSTIYHPLLTHQMPNVSSIGPASGVSHPPQSNKQKAKTKSNKKNAAEKSPVIEIETSPAKKRGSKKRAAAAKAAKQILQDMEPDEDEGEDDSLFAHDTAKNNTITESFVRENLLNDTLVLVIPDSETHTSPMYVNGLRMVAWADDDELLQNWYVCSNDGCGRIWYVKNRRQGLSNISDHMKRCGESQGSFKLKITRSELGEALHRATQIGALSGEIAKEDILKILPRKAPNKRQIEWSNSVLEEMELIPSAKSRSFIVPLASKSVSKLIEEARLNKSVVVPERIAQKYAPKRRDSVDAEVNDLTEASGSGTNLKTKKGRPKRDGNNRQLCGPASRSKCSSTIRLYNPHRYHIKSVVH